MRLPRFKTPDRLTYYHLRVRIAGPRHWYPFHQPEVPPVFVALLEKFLQLYHCDLVGWCLMGNHFHLIVRFQPYRQLSQRELERRAEAYYPRPQDRPQTPRQWRRFNRRLFDVSAFMRNLDGALARWFNLHFDRRGSLVADRFQSSILHSLDDVLSCLLYIDLNPLRAHLVQRPEDWLWGSARQRLEGDDHNLVSLRELMPGNSACRQEYRLRLYWRGAIAGEGKGTIPDAIIEAELQRGFGCGHDLQRQRWWSRGAVVGPYDAVAEWLRKLQELMIYRRRHRPISQLGGSCYSLRPQRRRRWDTAWATAGPG